MPPARAPRPLPPPPHTAVVISLAEVRLTRTLRDLARSDAAPPSQPFPWAYVFQAPPVAPERD